jgi:hypothetical protein
LLKKLTFTVATVAPFKLNVTWARKTFFTVPETVYVFAVALKAETVELAPFTVTVALAGVKLYPDKAAVTV